MQCDINTRTDQINPQNHTKHYYCYKQAIIIKKPTLIPKIPRNLLLIAARDGTSSIVLPI